VNATTHELGTCPHCDAAIPTSRVLIEYETSDGPSAYAECPDCRDVVHPA
jgi:NAD-dependent SIR2 family protein deacetylase